ncbi:MAG: hypothetical protein LBT86_05965 [Deltaproteobacteria bacterium]|jgi:phosphoribosyl 1,2-cyclic phosphodiesterase|nr:hypothetical protein [Deltaproteobacteria bacterium]
MIIKFWGVRGSIPCPPSNEEIRAKIRLALEEWTRPDSDIKDLDKFLDSLPLGKISLVGGNTPCLEISDEGQLLVFDAGTGLRNLGHYLVPTHISELFELFYATEKYSAHDVLSVTPKWPEQKINLFMTHTHWDHIQGFPFFRPAYAPNYLIDIYGTDKEALEIAFLTQQTPPSLFPAPLSYLRAKITFKKFPPQGQQFGQLFLDTFPLPHPGGSLAYRIRGYGQTIIFATDYEIQKLAPEGAHGLPGLTKFIAGADIFISDTQYTYLDHTTKSGWGHSNALSVVELATQAKVKRLFLFHHDPTYSDEKLFDILDKTRAYAKLLKNGPDMSVQLAMEGATIKL